MNESMLRGAIKDIAGNDALQSARKQLDSRQTLHESTLRDLIGEIVGSDALQSFRKIDARQTLKDLAIIYLFLAATILTTSYLHHLIGAYTLFFTPVLAL